MPVWPKSLYTFGLSLKTAATEWKLRQRRAAPAAQQKALDTLTAKLAASSYWRSAGLEAGMPYARFQARVPLHTLEMLSPAIERMQQGESDVLWPGRCALFARTSGTTTGQPRSLPVTEEMLAHFRRGSLDALLYYTVRVKHAGVFRGRHMIFGGSTALTPIAEGTAHAAFAGGLNGILAVNLPAWAEKHLYEPGGGIAKLPDGEAKVDAIVNRICQCDISLLASTPNGLLHLAAELQERSANADMRLPHLQTLWPNLECVVHTGLSATPHAAELRSAFGPTVKFHEVYAAAEGIIAAQDSDVTASGLRLMADLGVFFEFLPVTDFDTGRLDQIGTKAVPLSAVKTGVDYVLVLTTPAGLARTVVGDIVRFASTEPPRLIPVGRTALRLNAFGERVTEKELTDALVAVCSRHDWSITDFHVAPLHAVGSLTGQNRGRHEWWIELKAGTVATPTGPQIATALEVELQRSNPDYAARRKSGAVEPPTVRLVMPGVFKHWQRYHGRWDSNHKPSRCRNDRVIASELAQITNFAQD